MRKRQQLGQSKQVRRCDECPFVSRGKAEGCGGIASLFCGAAQGRLIPEWCPLPILVFGTPAPRGAAS